MSGRSVDTFDIVARLEGVPVALGSARDGIDALLRDRGLRRTTPAATGESLLRGAVASAQLAGGASTLEDVRAGPPDDVAMRAMRLNAELLRLGPVLARSPLQALARLHALAATGTAPADEVGRPRPDPNAAEMLHDLARRLLAPTAAPALAVAALAHAEVLVREPFGTANDLVARALERLLLVTRGVDPRSVLVPEAGHLAMRESYESALAAYRAGGPAGRRTWLLHAAAAIGHGVSASPLA
jgi:hypothetical protein